MIDRYLRTGPGALTAAVRELPLGKRHEDGIDHRVVDWAQGGLPEPAALEVEAKLHGYLQEAAALGRDLARRQCALWLLASALVLAVLVAYLAA
ncbi:hypothetical protein [Saccharothrix algeriensis]|uniref:Uncharacterized protein n=1 Tax=Saccharothrix algeriensis TaxID=173560 RepID=A0ABS2SEQ6_9PSEU|nr:hypothetical protein [Saccharothrix algeriensis]MBM7814708.1 hypothetical protein [Saccharothrix algeriensis]